jgi:hypothetical protein
MGTATFSISGTGTAATLTLSNISSGLPLVAGTYVRSNNGGGNGITGKWDVNATDTTEAYDFQSNGKLLVSGTDTGFTYTVNGNTISVSITAYGTTTNMGTATFSISGTGTAATLTLSNISGGVPLIAATYVRSTGGNNGGNPKPEKLSSSATHAQAEAKLDEIIKSPNTPKETVIAAEELKKGMPDASGWSKGGAGVIAAINALIDGIGDRPVEIDYYIVKYDGWALDVVFPDGYPNNQRYMSGSTVTIPKDLPIRKMYVFVEWNTNPDSKGTAYKPGSTFVITGDTVFYAIWAMEEAKEAEK